MSNRTGRRWYRLSSIVRPTPHSSRDPSPPRQNIEPPSSPTASFSSPPSPRSPLHDLRETKPTPALSSPETRHERVTTRQEIITYSAELFPAARSSHPPQPQPMFPPLRSKDVQEAKPRHERVTTRQEILAFPVKTHATKRPNKENQQQIVEELAQAARPSYHPPPKPMSPPLRPPLPEEVKEGKPSPVTSSRSIKQLPSNPKQERTQEQGKRTRNDQSNETTHQKNILTFPEETNLVHGPNETLPSEFDDDVFMDTQDIIAISADNKGAVMEILRSLNKTHRPNSLINDGKSVEPKSKSKSKNHIKNGGNCFVNSNVQMVNGSVVYNSSESHHDPGVNLSLYRIPSSGNGYIIKDHEKGYTSSIN